MQKGQDMKDREGGQGRKMEEERETGWRKKREVYIQHDCHWDVTAKQPPRVKGRFQGFQPQVKLTELYGDDKDCD